MTAALSGENWAQQRLKNLDPIPFPEEWPEGAEVNQSNVFKSVKFFTQLVGWVLTPLVIVQIAGFLKMKR